MIRKNKLERLRQQFPVGTRVELIEMDDQQAPSPGTRGTVEGVDDAGGLLMSWDTGSGLKLIVGVDRFRRVCPKCGKGYDGYPAMARIDGSDICTKCGVREALEAFARARK
jgi:hypothetical protein